MASSTFTTRLGLCKWADSDRPKRADFVSDNTIIDNVLGGHVNNSAVHMSTQEKEKALEPYSSIIYTGTGTAERTLAADFRPTFAMVYKKNAPPSEYSDGVNVVNCGFALYTHGGTSGVSISSSGVTVTQEQTASNGKRISLNEVGCQYVMVIFK